MLGQSWNFTPLEFWACGVLAKVDPLKMMMMADRHKCRPRRITRVWNRCAFAELKRMYVHIVGAARRRFNSISKMPISITRCTERFVFSCSSKRICFLTYAMRHGIQITMIRYGHLGSTSTMYILYILYKCVHVF